jgi:hypothetical protein
MILNNLKDTKYTISRIRMAPVVELAGADQGASQPAAVQQRGAERGASECTGTCSEQQCLLWQQSAFVVWLGRLHTIRSGRARSCYLCFFCRW